ncbi:hypothetical protein LTR85_009042 [Meristemomyces frigidus]|nr:hypothetical protein LTR85_009042 [Meristemomyces frigidus]
MASFQSLPDELLLEIFSYNIPKHFNPHECESDSIETTMDIDAYFRRNGINDHYLELASTAFLKHYEMMVDIVPIRRPRKSEHEEVSYEYHADGPGLESEDLREAAMAGVLAMLHRFESVTELFIVIVTESSPVANTFGAKLEPCLEQVKMQDARFGFEVLTLRADSSKPWRRASGEVVGRGYGVLCDGNSRALAV